MDEPDLLHVDALLLLQRLLDAQDLRGGWERGGREWVEG
jgi:hypothetical protein